MPCKERLATCRLLPAQGNFPRACRSNRMELVHAHGPNAVFIGSTGIGWGVHDRLAQLGCTVRVICVAFHCDRSLRGTWGYGQNAPLLNLS
jgi:hypothetical protein